MICEQEYARVHLLDAPLSLDRAFDYFIPSSMRSGIRRGSFVTVPFGKGNRNRLAVVTDFAERRNGDFGSEFSDVAAGIVHQSSAGT